jgi:hypothetical protein
MLKALVHHYIWHYLSQHRIKQTQQVGQQLLDTTSNALYCCLQSPEVPNGQVEKYHTIPIVKAQFQ